MINEDPTRDLAHDPGHDEDGSTPSMRDFDDTAEARLRAELRAARREERWRRVVEFIRLFTWWT